MTTQGVTSMEQPRRRNEYDDNFRRKVVDYHLEHHGSLADTGQKFGVTAGMLHKWLKKFAGASVGPNEEPVPVNPDLRELRREMQSIKDDVGELKKIVSKAFLKKFMDE